MTGSQSSLVLTACPVCGNTAGNRNFVAREMMFGSREQFSYCECTSCGSLWLSRMPDDLSRYYGRDYYSFSGASALRLWVRRHAQTFRLTQIVRTRKMPRLPEWWPPSGADRNDRILDIGSGAGRLLFLLNSLGFKHLYGLDPFIPQELRLPGGPTVFKKELSEMTGLFDVLLFNHSLEHMPDPRAGLRAARRLLAPGGTVIVRLPVASSFAWRTYGPDWVQLDPPRHLFVPTADGVRRLAEASGLTVHSITYDSTEFQFWGSEQYRRDIPLHDRRSYLHSPARSIFGRAQIREFAKHARELNQSEQGDQASFYLGAS